MQSKEGRLFFLQFKQRRNIRLLAAYAFVSFKYGSFHSIFASLSSLFFLFFLFFFLSFRDPCVNNNRPPGEQATSEGCRHRHRLTERETDAEPCHSHTSPLHLTGLSRPDDNESDDFTHPGPGCLNTLILALSFSSSFLYKNKIQKCKMIFLFIILMSPCRSIQTLTSPLY